ncbi:hypothetical protein FDECE_10646 [Fusarium decemcellulare]|nr:hypothetical protein FDECE_10646 [Fusarium decemcellulare]
MDAAFCDTPIWVFFRWALGASYLKYPEEEDGAISRIQAALERWEHLATDASTDLEERRTTGDANEKPCESGNDEGQALDQNVDSTHGPIVVVDWYNEEDTANPINWTGRKKLVVYLIVNFTACVVYMASAIYTPSQPLVQEVFGVSVTVASQGLGLFIVGYGVGPLIWSPMSEMPAVGRNLPYLVPLLVFVIISVPTALANSIGSLLVLRFLQGFFGSPVLSTGGASLTDIVDVYKRPYSLYTWAIFSFAGPSIGNVMAGFTVPELGWRWSLWEIVITTGPALILLLFLPETSPNTILYYRARRIRKVTGKDYFMARSEIEAAHKSVLDRFYGTLVTPWKINLLDPSIMFTSIYCGLIYAIFYSFFEFFPLVYGNIYGMSQGQIGLVLLCNVVSVAVAALPYFAYVHFVINVSARKGKPLTPEQRLMPALCGAVLVPVGIFLFGWASRDSVHWIVPTLGVCLTVGGFAVLLQTIFVYIGLAYPQYSASLFCGNGFVKQMVAYAGVIWSHPLYDAMGISKAMSLLGTLCVWERAPQSVVENLCVPYPHHHNSYIPLNVKLIAIFKTSIFIISMDGFKTEKAKDETTCVKSHDVVEEGSISPGIEHELTWAEQFTELKRSWRCALSCFACASMAILIGYDMNLMGSIIANNEFVETFGVYDESLEAWTLPANRQLVWTICQFVAAIMGAFCIGIISDRLGRRICVFINITLTMIGTVIELVAPSWGVWAVAKVVFGLAMGFMQGNTQTYVSEIAHSRIRGFMLSLFQLWIIVGSFLASCVLEGTSKIDGKWSWKSAVASQFGIGVICLGTFVLLVPESPYYLATRGKTDKARNALVRLHRPDPGFHVDEELNTIISAIEHEKSVTRKDASYLDCFRGVDRRRTLLACLPMVMQQFGGFPLCGNYLAYFLRLAGLDDAFLITVIANVLSIVAILVSFSLVEKVGRRPQLLYGFAGMLPCLLAISILGWVGKGTDANGRALAAFSIIWNILYFISLGAIGWTIVGEISSIRLRAKTTSIATISNAICNLGWAVAIPYLINAEEANLGPKSGVVFLGPQLPFREGHTSPEVLEPPT